MPHYLLVKARVLGGACLVIGGWMLLDRRVKLRIDQVGIRYSRWGGFVIPWGQLRGVELREVPYSHVVQLLPRPEFDLHSRVPRFWRFCGWVMQPWSVDEFAIAAGGLEHGFDQILTAIRSHLAASGAGYRNK